VSPTSDAVTHELSAAWLAARMGVDPARLDARRRAGELIAIRAPGSLEWRYPAWQFEHGRARPGVSRIVATAREAGVDDERLYDLMTTPLGLRRGDGRRLCDLLAEGRVDEVVAAIRSDDHGVP
jgi:hypothetical protein